MTTPLHYFVIDRSGSMANKWDDTIGAINEYAKSIGGEDEIKILFFDAHHTSPVATFREKVKAKDFVPLSVNDVSIRPRGGTPLFDAIGIAATELQNSGLERAIMIIVTDGQENESKEYTRESSKALLDFLRTKNYQIQFIGADFDNFNQAYMLGAARGASVSLNAGDATQMFHSLAATNMAYTSGKANDTMALNDVYAASKKTKVDTK